MTAHARIILIFLSAIIVLAAIPLSGCSKKQERMPEAPVQSNETQTPAPPAQDEQSTTAPRPEPPKPAEVRAVVSKIFQTAVTVDTEHPYDYIAGDFNGDGSYDIAIVVKPVEASLPDINSEVANWILEDPRKVIIPDASKATQVLPPPPEPVKVAKSDTLLAIIHGFGPEGWRAARARQTYLLRGGAGADMSVKPATEVQTLARSSKKNVKFGQGVLQRGEVIKETLNGKPGYLYFSGAKYVWFQ